MPAFALPAVPPARVQPRQAARKTARGMTGSKLVHVEGYFRKDGTWVPPHTREWDGVKNPTPPKRVNGSSVAGKSARNASGFTDDDPAVSAITAKGDWTDEDFDHLIDDDGKPLERPGVRMAARGGAAAVIPEDRIHEWRDRDGKILAVGWVGSRLGAIIWIRTAAGESIRAEVDDLCLDDQEFLDNMK